MKRLLSIGVAIGVGIAFAVTPAGAHHSIASSYDTRLEITMEGVIARFQFVNPHPFVMLDVTNGGDTVQWMLEMDNRSELARIGMNSQTLKQGDQVVVTGSPANAGKQSLYIRRLDRPADGFRYEQVGSSPRIRTAR